jgi:hypothetical protein
MSINEKTKYRISNKFINGKVDKDQFEFENKGKFGKGRLTWSVPIKKDGQTTFENSSIGFVCFGDNVGLIESNLGAKFSIGGTISQKKNPNATGDQPKTYWQIVAYEVSIAEESLNQHSVDKEDDSFEKAAKLVDKHNAAKANSYVKEPEDLDLSDDIPF